MVTTKMMIINYILELVKYDIILEEDQGFISQETLKMLENAIKELQYLSTKSDFVEINTTFIKEDSNDRLLKSENDFEMHEVRKIEYVINGKNEKKEYRISEKFFNQWRSI